MLCVKKKCSGVEAVEARAPPLCAMTIIETDVKYSRFVAQNCGRHSNGKERFDVRTTGNHLLPMPPPPRTHL